MMRKHPDIILLVLDTQRLDGLSCYGYKTEMTPNLDKFAGQATRFEQAITTAQWTVPAHASLFTGLYPSQHTLHQMDGVLPVEVATLAERLKQSGYFTAGYSHNPLVGAVPNGLQRGFLAFENYHSPEAGLLAFQFDKQKQFHSINARLRHRGRYLLAELSGHSHHSVLRHLSTFGEPFWRMLLTVRRQSKAALAATSLRNAARLLVERPGLQPEQPVFVFINLMGTHVPYDPPGWAIERFLPGKVGKREARRLLQQANRWQADVCNWLNMPALSQENMTLLQAFYDGEVVAQDVQIGIFLERLRKGGVIDQSLVIVTADHGDHLGDKQRLNHAFGVYNSLIQVPLIIHDAAGEMAKSVVEQGPVSTRRIYHTILAAAGIASADEARLSLANQALAADVEMVIAEGFPLLWAADRLEKYRPGEVHENGYDKLIRAVYMKDHKLIAGDNGCELYNLHHDPGEMFDLSQKEPELVKAMQEDLTCFTTRLEPIVNGDLRRDIEDEAILAQLRSLGYIE